MMPMPMSCWVLKATGERYHAARAPAPPLVGSGAAARHRLGDMEKVRAAALADWNEAVDFAADAFASTGVPEADARKAADALVDADLHGTVTHGLKNLRNYVSGLLNGTINPRPNM